MSGKCQKRTWNPKSFYPVSRRFLCKIKLERFCGFDIYIATATVTFLELCETASIKDARIFWRDLQCSIVVSDGLVELSHFEISKCSTIESACVLFFQGQSLVAIR